ncbi:hypothetical protein Fleli_3142 [Bernardetia litoralis DSM 6794]|uniref:Immunity protein 35 domain-containing protein n=1 Tax=Bernardetia litoralis (strain ATCC 23117 / DSM 6794 / NBRC 15988 / NCIMB 1366 / Fx l1 / Sio-4) TaxID=880071 RepID=I4ANE3_BERLS|nr:YrhB family protein [Bernardetia litoralis]AFM05478.1 hypothetical protein Fleli_3142 [Bernardetia litoralis DSM 6794]
MIDYKEAKKIAKLFLNRIDTGTRNDKCIITDNIEYDFGWIFFYQSSIYLETNDPLYMLAGNIPIIVDRVTKNILFTGSEYDISYYADLYKKYRNDIGKYEDLT